MISLPHRPRRNRATPALRDLVRETHLRAEDLILPLFVQAGTQQKSPIASMPGVFRFSQDLIVKEVLEAYKTGIRGVLLFPVIPDNQKDKHATESKNPKGLLQQTVQLLKQKCPEMTVMTDVAMDPYSIDGHDGYVEKNRILNDATLEILAAQAVSQARAGADIVAPSDMMDGRIKFIRRALDENGFTDVGILAYSAKYASAFYGPFREALDSAPRFGDKKTYQMDPANKREALRETLLDVNEGADMIMIKPALAYLDVIHMIKSKVHLPIVAYQVSGEFAQIMAAAQLGWLDAEKVMDESLLSIKRAGADMIVTYDALRVAQRL